ncbi:DNRLRE domain-containing protein [Candidatus Bathyarchaeota archaeon]|nr:DNRLRE domain-containing protein [Candidatus Bathyarchaeota archaeon]
MVLTAEAVNATLTVIQPSNADTHIYEGDPNNNFGASDGFVVGAVSGGRFRGLVKFDLSSIPSGSTVNVAYLLLYYYYRGENNPAGRTYNAYRVTKDWVETQATWNVYSTGNSWTTPGGDYTTDGGSSSTVPANTEQWMIWDVTSIVKAWIEGGQPNYGFIIRDQSEGVVFSADFRSKEVSDPDLRPILKVDWSTPTPTPTPRPVGGVLVPVKKLELLTPYLALVGLVGVVTAIILVRRKRED